MSDHVCDESMHAAGYACCGGILRGGVMAEVAGQPRWPTLFRCDGCGYIRWKAGPRDS